MSKKELIPEIYVYCDRWCEPCPFTSRCEIFDPADQERDWSAVDANELMQEVTASFEKTMSLLKKEADASGINWNQLVADAKEVELEEPVLPVEPEEVVALAEHYRSQVNAWLSKYSKEIEQTTIVHAQNLKMGIKEAEKNNALFVEAFETINWYHALIEAKVRRAISGLHNDFEDSKENLTQNHENGCAKITMLFIEKSIRAWEQISAEMTDQEDKILDHLATLSRLSGKFHKIFPNHEAFIRPGFDTLGMKNK